MKQSIRHQYFHSSVALDWQLQIARDSTNSFGQSWKIFNERLQGVVASKLEAARGCLSRSGEGRHGALSPEQRGLLCYEVLQEQQLLFPAEDLLVQTQLNQLFGVVQLYRALGGGWEVESKRR